MPDFDQAAFNTAFQAAVQPVLDQFQVHIAGTATPINPDIDPFDYSGQATPSAS